MTGYDLTRKWFDYALSNPDKVSSSHTALYLWMIELNNRLGWVDKFGLTVREAMDGMSCKSRNTYSKCFHDLIDWKFIELIKKSQNQYHCNIIALLKFEQPKSKRLFKNSTTTDTTTGAGTGNITDTIPKTYKRKNVKTKKPFTVARLSADQTVGVFNNVKEFFLEMYASQFETGYVFSGKDGTKIQSLIKKVHFKMKEKRGDVDFSVEELSNATKMVLSASLKLGDKFLNDNYTLSQIDSKFNEIYLSIKNGKSRATTATTKQSIINAVDEAFK